MNKIILALILLFSIPCYGAIIFEDDFDDHSDWEPSQGTHGSDARSNDGDSTTACTGCPGGTAKYAGYYLQGSAWNSYTGNNTMKISTDNARSGKALTHWTETVQASCDGNAWCSDGQLAIDLGDNYTDIYIRFYIKFDSTYVWNSIGGGGDSYGKEKLFRVTHWTDTGYHFFNFGTNTETDGHHPYNILDMSGYYYANALYFINNPRYQATFYPNYATPSGHVQAEHIRYSDGEGGYLTWAETMADGNWHLVIWHMKMNTAGGYYVGTPNGVSEVFIDVDADGNTDTATYQYTNSTFAWCDAEDPQNTWSPAACPGWNWISIGGNSRNQYYNAATVSSELDAQNQEHWYAIDDLVVATTLEEALSGTTAPYFVSATISTAAAQITLSEDVVITGLDDGDFKMTGTTTGEVSLNSCTEDTGVISCTAASSFVFGETVTLAYSGGVDEVENIGGEDLAVFSGSAVTNNTPDTTNPVTIIATSDPTAISVNSLTITGSSSDNDAVVGCKWRIGSAPDADNGTACTGNTSFSCNTSGYDLGANTAYVGCYDNADNYGSDSITVNYSTATVNGIACGNNGSLACGNNGSVN